MKKRIWLKILGGLLAAVLLLLAGLVGYLSATEYRPQARQAAEWLKICDGRALTAGASMTVYSWNIGYAGLDAKTDFFMDGGQTVNPTAESVAENLAAIQAFIAGQLADAWLLQEVDVRSARTGYVNELEAIAQVYPSSYALAYNYKCAFVPIPWPPIGKMESGIATFAGGCVNGTPERLALPCPFSWPVSVANLKRCLLVTRLAVADSDKELVLVNLHLEAYDDGEGKLAQTRELMEFLRQEYEKGNYVIAGGDFNQMFPGASDAFPVVGDVWTPGTLAESDLPEGFRYAFDGDTASCRLLNRPLDENSQLYAIDGFILSPNVRLDAVETVDLGFALADHNPVRLQATLLVD